MTKRVYPQISTWLAICATGAIKLRGRVVNCILQQTLCQEDVVAAALGQERVAVEASNRNGLRSSNIQGKKYGKTVIS